MSMHFKAIACEYQMKLHRCIFILHFRRYNKCIEVSCIHFSTALPCYKGKIWYKVATPTLLSYIFKLPRHVAFKKTQIAFAPSLVPKKCPAHTLLKETVSIHWYFFFSMSFIQSLLKANFVVACLVVSLRLFHSRQASK